MSLWIKQNQHNIRVNRTYHYERHLKTHRSISISKKERSEHPFQFTRKQKETSPMVKSRIQLISLPLPPISHSFSSFHFHVRVHFRLFIFHVRIHFLLSFHVLAWVHHFFSSCFFFVISIRCDLLVLVLVRTTMGTFLCLCGAPNFVFVFLFLFHILIWFECMIIPWPEKINVSALNRHYPEVT